MSQVTSEKLHERVAVKPFERRLADGVVAAGHHGDLVWNLVCPEVANQLAREPDREGQVVAGIDEECRRFPHAFDEGLWADWQPASS